MSLEKAVGPSPAVVSSGPLRDTWQELWSPGPAPSEREAPACSPSRREGGGGRSRVRAGEGR